MKNYYGSLCTKMYEILHPSAPQDELDFYISFANKSDLILEPLCGSGRFLIPFIERGFNIQGFDLSKEMLDELLIKNPLAKVYHKSIDDFSSEEKFDYIFIASGSMSLFTTAEEVFNILVKMKNLLSSNGKFIFEVCSIMDKQPTQNDYTENHRVVTNEGYELILKSKCYFEDDSKVLYNPSLYELYNSDDLIQSEEMDFRIKLYDLGELDELILKAGFNNIKLYTSFDKSEPINKSSGVLLYECSL